MESALDVVLLAVTAVVTVLVFAAVIRRLLGVRPGPIRTLLAAVLALLVAGPLLQAFLPDPEDADATAAVLFVLLAVSCASLLAMVVLVIAEVVVPDGSLPGPVEVWRGSRARAVRTRRYVQVLRIALRHGLGRFLRGRRHLGLASSSSRRDLARSLRRAMDEGGVTFVKLGQQLSTRRDLLPVEFAEELGRLQDQAAPVPWLQIRAVLAAELGGPVEDVLPEVQEAPLAAASVAQVHAARLPDGTDVVVKVQRPGVTAVVERDLDIVRHLARLLEDRTGWGRSLGAVDLAAGFSEALREELDFTIERDNLRAMAAALRASPHRGVRIPVPYEALSTGRVLVMERLTGTPLGAADPVLTTMAPDRRRSLADSLLASVFDQVLEHGRFHVDLHPGNVLLLDDGALGLLDLGSVGRIDATTRLAFARLLGAVGSGDSQTAVDALLELVDRPDEIDERALERALGGLIVRYAAAGATMGPAVFAALFRLITEHRLAVPPQVAALFRTFATLEGTLARLDPAFDLVGSARDTARSRFASSLTRGRLRRSAEEELVALLPILRRLPRRLDRVADAVEHGRLGVNVRLFADSRDRRWITGLVHQGLLTVIAATAGVMAVLLLDMPGGPRLTDTVRIFPVFGYALLIVSVVLVLRVLVAVFRQEQR